MISRNQRRFKTPSLLLIATTLFMAPLASFGQAAKPLSPAGGSASQSAPARSAPTDKQDMWLHVRVDSPDSKGERVRVNIPVELAEKILPTINDDKLHGGKISINCMHGDDVDLHTLMEAVRTAKDGEYVTVQSEDNDVRVAKQGGHLIIHVLDKGKSKKGQVEVKVPMKVVDALFSAGKDDLDLVAALHVLSGMGDTELVSMKDEENTVRIWVDSKNVTE
jgi:hypothetical protein